MGLEQYFYFYFFQSCFFWIRFFSPVLAIIEVPNGPNDFLSVSVSYCFLFCPTSHHGPLTLSIQIADQICTQINILITKIHSSRE